jgi:Tfp pilus assembly protein PilF
MRRVSVLTLLLSLLCVAHAEGPDDEYIQIYNLIQQADAAGQASDPRTAAEKYLEAQTALQKLHKIYPQWNEKVVQYRLNYISEQLTPLSKFVPQAHAPVPTVPLKKMSPAELEKQVQLLGQVQQLTGEREELKSKLEEAFSTKAVSPREMKKAEDRISALEKERDLLKTSLEEQKAKEKKIAQQAREDAVKGSKNDSQRLAGLELEHGNLRLKYDALNKQFAGIDARHSLELKAVEAERDAIKKKLDEATQQTGSGKGSELEAARIKQLEQKLDEANRQLSQVAPLREDLQSRDMEMKRLQRVEIERDELKRRLAALSNTPGEVKPVELRTESESVKQLEKDRDELRQQLDTTRKELAAMQALHEEDMRTLDKHATKLVELQTERDALQKRIGNATAQVERSQSGSVDLSKLKKVEDERDQLKKDLDATIKELADLEASKDEDSLGKRSAMAVEAKKAQDALAGQIEQLRSKLQVLEAKPEPFSAEELALFKKPEPQVVKVDKSTEERPVLSAKAASAVADAERAFAEHHFEDAEAKYKQALKEDDKDVSILANLAATQLALNKADEAEQTIKRASQKQANDPYLLLVLGKVKFTQGKFDDALDVLSRSARLNPNNAETQNYLGITLSEKGQRQPAEAALRAAIKLQPDNAGAHHNLAVVYATQKPPFVELARWHYQKAVELGHGKNADLEKILSEAK